MPKVSVIIPNYNHAPYLKQRIESVLEQTYQDFEIILLDDCSTDASCEILLSYKNHPKVTSMILNEQNSGSTFLQWDKGLHLATGEYIWIAESDDYADSSFLESCIKAFSENSDAVLTYTGSQMIDAQSSPICSMDWDHFQKNDPPIKVFSSKEFLKKHLLWKNEIYNASMVVFKKHCYDKISYDFQQFRYCGDWLFWIGICQQGSVIKHFKKLNYFRQHLLKVSPQAEKDGLYFTEGGRIMRTIINNLQLTCYQKKVIGGRTLKRLKKQNTMDRAQKEILLKAHTEYYGKNGFWSVLLYEFDKFFNFSTLHS